MNINSIATFVCLCVCEGKGRKKIQLLVRFLWKLKRLGRYSVQSVQSCRRNDNGCTRGQQDKDTWEPQGQRRLMLRLSGLSCGQSEARTTTAWLKTLNIFKTSEDERAGKCMDVMEYNMRFLALTYSVYRWLSVCVILQTTTSSTPHANTS